MTFTKEATISLDNNMSSIDYPLTEYLAAKHKRSLGALGGSRWPSGCCGLEEREGRRERACGAGPTVPYRTSITRDMVTAHERNKNLMFIRETRDANTFQVQYHPYPQQQQASGDGINPTYLPTYLHHAGEERTANLWAKVRCAVFLPLSFATILVQRRNIKPSSSRPVGCWPPPTHN